MNQLDFERLVGEWILSYRIEDHDDGVAKRIAIAAEFARDAQDAKGAEPEHPRSWLDAADIARDAFEATLDPTRDRKDCVAAPTRGPCDCEIYQTCEKCRVVCPTCKTAYSSHLNHLCLTQAASAKEGGGDMTARNLVRELVWALKCYDAQIVAEMSNPGCRGCRNTQCCICKAKRDATAWLKKHQTLKPRPKRPKRSAKK